MHLDSISNSSQMTVDAVLEAERRRQQLRAQPLCPWCDVRPAGSYTKDGKPSHGICRPCYDEQMALIADLRQPKEVA